MIARGGFISRQSRPIAMTNKNGREEESKALKALPIKVAESQRNHVWDQRENTMFTVYQKN